MSDEQQQSTTPAAQPRSIYDRLIAAALAIGYIKKDATITGGGTYKAVSHDQVTAHTRGPLLAEGVLVLPSVLSSEVVDTGRKTSSGNPIIRYQGRFRVRFVSSGTFTAVHEAVHGFVSEVTLEVDAHAEDQGDKAPGKALSYAVKSAVLKALQLETGESDESRVQEDEPAQPLSELEIAGLKRELETAAAKDVKALRAATARCFALAKERRDLDAHAAIKAYSSELADKIAPETAGA